MLATVLATEKRSVIASVLDLALRLVLVWGSLSVLQLETPSERAWALVWALVWVLVWVLVSALVWEQV